MQLTSFGLLHQQIISDPDNAAMTAQGAMPVYVADAAARVAVIGQAPGKRAQETGLAWNDASGRTLWQWLGVTEEQFRDPRWFAILPMDFYFPGKGPSGDLPPRKNFASRWHPALLDLMPDIRLTLLIGRYAQQRYLGARQRESLTATVKAFSDYHPYFPLVHPSPLNFRWQNRNPWFAQEVLPVLRRRVAEAMG
jgi:uracil-DNA glycosylase